MIGRRIAWIFVAFLALLSAAEAADTKVLVIGASHTTGTYKDGLLDALKQPDIKTAVYASCGSSSQHWLGDDSISGCPYTTNCGYYERSYDGKVLLVDKLSEKTGRVERVPPQKHATPDMNALMKSGKPDLVVIGLGTNELASNLVSAEGYCRRLIDVATHDGAKCVWVGPPNVGAQARGAKNLGAYYKMLEKVTKGRCLLIDSRENTDAKDVEKKYWVHYPGRPGYNWGTVTGARILRFIRENGPTSGANSATSSSATTPAR